MSIDAPISPPFPANRHAPVATHTVFLSLGANIGDRRSNLVAALQRLRKVVKLENISSTYETEPVGYTDQPSFFNIVCQGKTWLDVEQLLKHTQEIEVAIGRKPSFRNGPRPIDIDILFYNDCQIEQEQLTIPHPRLRERAFVLVPLVEIAPETIEPVSGKTASELLATLTQEGVNRLTPDLRISFERDLATNS